MILVGLGINIADLVNINWTPGAGELEPAGKVAAYCGLAYRMHTCVHFRATWKAC